ncbi:hypothetical protein GGI06_003188, partial [Coemansia sp. S85]
HTMPRWRPCLVMTTSQAAIATLTWMTMRWIATMTTAIALQWRKTMMTRAMMKTWLRQTLPHTLSTSPIHARPRRLRAAGTRGLRRQRRWLTRRGVASMLLSSARNRRNWQSARWPRAKKRRWQWRSLTITTSTTLAHTLRSQPRQQRQLLKRILSLTKIS